MCKELQGVFQFDQTQDLIQVYFQFRAQGFLKNRDLNKIKADKIIYFDENISQHARKSKTLVQDLKIDESKVFMV